MRKFPTAGYRFDIVVNLPTSFGYFSTFMERVRMFEPDELRRRLYDAGFAVDREFGGCALRPLDVVSSRAIFRGAP
jgi:hypothetical protein